MQKPLTARQTILNNLGWGLASFALAVLIWYAAASADNPTREERFPEAVPIAITPDAGLVIVNRPANTARVTLRALESAWRVIGRENIRLGVDLAGLGPGTHVVEVKGTLTDITTGAIVRIQPERISIELAPRDEKLVNVSVQFSSEPPVGYTATAASAQTAVRVSGVQDHVAQVQTVQAKVSLQGRRSAFSISVLLTALDAENRPVQDVELTPAEVVVDVDVRQRADVTELTVDPRFVPGTLSPGYLRPDYRWDPRRIFVRGDPDAIARMGGIAPTEPIDLTGKTQTFTQVVRVILPDGVTMPDPTDISVTVVIEPVMLSREFAEVPVQAQGIDPADYRIAILPETVRVIVTGPATVVNDLKAEDVRVFAPLSGFSAGTYTVTLQASVSQADVSAEDVRILTSQVEVTITARNPTPTPTLASTPTPTPGPTTAP